MFFILSLILAVLLGQKNKTSSLITQPAPAAKVEAAKPAEKPAEKTAPKSLSEELPAEEQTPAVPAKAAEQAPAVPAGESGTPPNNPK
jgi:hypothetical protein